PYATGVNWACALEPAFRAWSWLWAYHLTADALDRDIHLEWLRGFYDHGRFLARHLEYYASPYSHLIGEASVLYALGCCFPEFRASSTWRRLGRRVLEERLDQQFYADGGSVEQSCFYHHATTGFYILAGLVARANREDLRPAVWTAIERALDYSARLMQTDGKTQEPGGAHERQADPDGAPAVLGLPAVPRHRRRSVRTWRFQDARRPLLRGRALAAGSGRARRVRAAATSRSGGHDRAADRQRLCDRSERLVAS